MSTDTSPSQTRFTGKTEYHGFVDDVIGLAQHEIRIFDQQLEKAFNAPARHDALRRFLLSNRKNRLRIVVHDAATIERDCPRMLDLLRAFNHAMAIHETRPEARNVYDLFVIADELHSVRRFHFNDLRGLYARDDPIEAHTLVERFEEIWDASAPAVAPTTIGL
jgi:hypothetical protein